MGEPINVPLLDLSAQNQPLAAELKAAFARVLDSSQFILGPEVAGFESAAAELAGARHAIGTSSGTDALLLSLMTLGVGPGDEVLCPSFTFFATAGAIARTGA
ncbi:MAG: aminotransferase class I/II-fold pyridoxal phosphate-dependent enzyme, partial [Pedosphaera sp.]|nr:aminotransferase class I/II-fold pyridoxal phosphate-dependent enzyme [Pedosphaera sp.]